MSEPACLVSTEYHNHEITALNDANCTKLTVPASSRDIFSYTPALHDNFLLKSKFRFESADVSKVQTPLPLRQQLSAFPNPLPPLAADVICERSLSRDLTVL